MTAASTTDSNAASSVPSYDKNEPGRGYIVVIYGLYISSIMALITAPIGALIAWWRLKKSAAWLDSHLQFQLRTFCITAAMALMTLGLWNFWGVADMPSIYAWSMGYIFFTLQVIWMMGRCGVGINYLMHNRPIPNPRSWLFGTAVSFK